MRGAVIAAGILLLVARGAVPAHAQFRGGLTSRPSAPALPRPPAAPQLPLVPVWWPWGVVVLSEPATLTPSRVIDGGPTGGVQLDVQPWSAQVYVDGALAGRVEEFRGYYRHLELPAGPHVVAIVHPGYAPLVAEVVVVPGRTITYRATLR